jgi:Membrane bound beta barrel domain (DUF5777)
MKNKIAIVIALFVFGFASAQDDLFKSLDSIQTKEKEITPYAFKGLQICNMQSTKLPAKGEWYVLISHRFGDLTNGLDNFFGLDEAATKIGGIYGATNWLSLGVSRHRNDKIYELAVKYKMVNQMVDGFPVTIVGYNTMDINSALEKAANPELKFTNRLAFTTQLLISRKFSDILSFQLAPIFVHKNLYDDTRDQKDLFLIGAGGRCKLSKRMSLNLEYAARTNLTKDFTSPYKNPLSLGLDIETGGHVFQMVFANSQPMNDVAFLSNSNGKWNTNRGGGIYFGFNMYRVF